MLNAYVDSVKDVEKKEKTIEKLKAEVEKKQKTLEEKQAKLSSEEEFLRKEQTEWKNNSARRTKELEDSLKVR